MSWERSKTLSLIQRDFLLKFFERSQDFFLTGGSALGIFYLDHHVSYDLDLFTTSPVEWRRVDALVSWVCDTIGAERSIVVDEPYFRRYKLRRGQEQHTIDLVVETVPQVDKEKNRFGVVIVDTIREIGVNKLTALLGRAEIKDLIDLYFLSQNGFDILGHVEAAKQKDGGMEPTVLSFLLSRVFVREIPDYVIAELSAEDLNRFLDDLRKGLAEMAFPGEHEMNT